MARKWSKEQRAKYAQTVAERRQASKKQERVTTQVAPEMPATIPVLENGRIVEYELRTVKAYVRKES